MSKKLSNAYILEKVSESGFREETAHSNVSMSVGEQCMLRDLGLTISELRAGLEGRTVQEWMSWKAFDAGLPNPSTDPFFQMELSKVQFANAQAHNMDMDSYLAVGSAIVKERMGQLWGSNMSGEQYMEQGMSNMDWSDRNVDARVLETVYNTKHKSKKLAKRDIPSMNEDFITSII